MRNWTKYSKDYLGEWIERLEKDNEDLREYIRYYLVGDKKSALIAKIRAILKKKKGGMKNGN